MKFILVILLVTMSACATSSVESEYTVERDLSQMTLVPKWGSNFELLGFEYPFRVCAKKFLWHCSQWRLVKQDFPETNSELMRIIKAKDFVCKQREQP